MSPVGPVHAEQEIELPLLGWRWAGAGPALGRRSGPRYALQLLSNLRVTPRYALWLDLNGALCVVDLELCKFWPYTALRVTASAAHRVTRYNFRRTSALRRVMRYGLCSCNAVIWKSTLIQ